MNISALGHFPVDGTKARETGEFFKVTPNDMCHTILGETCPILMSFYFSTCYLNFGTFEVPTGGTGPRYSKVMKHEGDAILYCLSDEMTVQIVGSEDVFHAHKDEAVFIPEGVPYRIANYTRDVAKGVFAICPKL